jgi:hypothetical protein
MTIQTQDPAVQWADLLHELSGARRDAAIAALRHSANSGWPASRASVVSLVAYAQGRITAAEYAARTLVDLGLADAQTAPALLRAVSTPAPQSAPAPTGQIPSSAMDATAGAEFLFGRDLGSFDRSASAGHDSAAKAYVAGRLPLEEFLRAARDDFI